jgi:hypothetical protein
MFNNILRSLSFGRLGRPAPRPYGKVGGGLLFPALAYLGWRYRDRIQAFARDTIDSVRRGRGEAIQPAGTTLPLGSRS